MPDVVPFTCQSCGAPFPEHDGFLCERCGRILCRRHLAVGVSLRAVHPMCRDCRRELKNAPKKNAP